MRNIYKGLKQYINFSGTATAREFLDFLVFIFTINLLYFIYPLSIAQPTCPLFYTVLSCLWLAFIIFNLTPLLAVTTRRTNAIGLNLPAKIFVLISIFTGTLSSAITPYIIPSTTFPQQATALFQCLIISAICMQALLYCLPTAIIILLPAFQQQRKIGAYLKLILITSLILILSFSTVMFFCTALALSHPLTGF
jgi:uncharacterized membrane protein YhaH (DUF805 family)